jgi:splicing factor 3A subunit 3
MSRNVSNRRRTLRRNGTLVRSTDGKTKLLPKLSRMEARRASGVQLVSQVTPAVADSALTLTSPGQKMYSKQTVYDAHLTSKKHVKATQKQATSSEPPKNPNGTGATSSNNSMPPPSSLPKDKYKPVALYTHLTTALLSALSPVLVDTKSNVERRFSLTAREREQELLEQSMAPPPPPSTTTKEGEEEEEEERIYNPLKLPLGWDGKPIPYWLYKLHGLGVEYRCEICSDHVYMGRKNFERHFQESRHAFGMRALGLPNTKHFHEITKIEDALTCEFLLFVTTFLNRRSSSTISF